MLKKELPRRIADRVFGPETGNCGKLFLQVVVAPLAARPGSLITGHPALAL